VLGPLVGIAIERVIAAREQELTRKLADPRYRALRQQHGIAE
jgi:hypothetical protein